MKKRKLAQRAPLGRTILRRAASSMTGTSLVLHSDAAGKSELSATAEEIEACALKMAPFRSRLKVPEIGPEQRDRLTLLFDENADLRTHMNGKALQGAERVRTHSGVSTERLDTFLGQYREMRDVRLATRRLARDIGDSQALVGAAQRKLVQKVETCVRGLLDTLPETERDRLQEDAAEFLEELRKGHAQKQAQKAQTERDGAAGDEDRTRAERHNHLLATMLELREGREVAAEDLDDADETYRELVSGEKLSSPKRRTRR